MKLREKATKMPVEVGVGINGFWTENSDKLFIGVNYTLKELAEKYEDIPTVEEIYKDYDDWAKEVEVEELPSGLRIADMDYYKIDEDGEKKTKFTWDEAMERFKDDPNWRLPTPKELNQIALDLGYNDDGIFWGEIFAKNLGHEGESSGFYWSSSAYNDGNSCHLSFNSEYVIPQEVCFKMTPLAIRCVARKGN